MIRPYVVPLRTLQRDGVLHWVVAAVRGMDAGQARYKLGDHRDAVLRILEATATA